MMQRIRAVLDKLTLLAQRRQDRSVLDIDLMLDYTRMMYADLLDMRSTLAAKADIITGEPTLDELTAAVAKREETVAPVQPIAAAPMPVAQPRPASPVTGRDIRSYIDLNEKYLLLSGLFRNDIHAYEEAMKSINGLPTENDALQWLGARQWPAAEDAVQTLRELLKRFYS